jgi:hypothetical protein
MKHERIGAGTPKNANPGLLCGSRDYVAESDAKVHVKAALKATDGSGVRVLQDREFGHLIGSPKVLVEHRGGSAFVSVQPRPWGWQNVDREFLNANSPGVSRYADKLLAAIHETGKREHERRERLKEARQRERTVRA